uniref:Uncharacterized protein n=1 Tax=Rhizophora mucronata TaxID=61149 RepID=A0A2P2KVA8_RHIMU
MENNSTVHVFIQIYIKKDKIYV